MASRDVTQLKFPENIRARYGMYIGDANNPKVIFREIVDNSMDEILTGNADTIRINTRSENGINTYYVCDNGGGLPIKEAYDKDNTTGKITKLGITMARLAMGTLHAGSKFDKTQIMTGMNGVGASSCVALSNKFVVYCKLSKHNTSECPKHVIKLINEFSSLSESSYYRLEFNKGNYVGEYIVDINGEDVPDTIKEFLPSTLTMFEPDDTIFSSTKCKVPFSTEFSKFLYPNTHYFINDIESTEVPTSFDYNIKVRCYNTSTEDVLNPYVDFVISFGISEKFDDYSHTASVNALDTQSGLHVRAVEYAYNKAFSEFFGNVNDKAQMGVNFLNITMCNEPTFSSQTKERLADVPDFNMWDLPELINEFKIVIRKNRDQFELNYRRILEYLKTIDNLDKITKLKSQIVVLADNPRAAAYVPRKLKDCTTSDRSKAELYLCEGNSAAGTLLQAREGLDYIAVLPLRGKPLNSVNMDISDVLENGEMYDFINSVGVGVNEYHSTEQIRYNKIILLADADADGASINALLLGVILYHMTFLLDEGYVYVCRTPLYQQGDTYIYPGEEDKLDPNKPIDHRFKGLGELNPSQLKTFAFNKDTRKLIKVTNANADYALSLLSSTFTRNELLTRVGIINNKPLTYGEYNEQTV